VEERGFTAPVPVPLFSCPPEGSFAVRWRTAKPSAARARHDLARELLHLLLHCQVLVAGGRAGKTGVNGVYFLVAI
jgi:hypothetical protein